MPVEPEESAGGEPGTDLGEKSENLKVSGKTEETTEGSAENQGIDYEEIASQGGWKPEDDYEGAEGSWVGAEEFVKRAPLFEKIKGQSKTIAKMEKTMKAMSDQFMKNSEALSKKHMAELKAAKREAIEVGDADKVEAIEKEMEDAKAPEEVKDGIPEEINKFLDANSWYDRPGNEEMTRFAKAHNRSCLDDGMVLEDALTETAKAVKRAFPDKFENKRKQKPSPVETHSQPAETGAGTAGYKVSRLSADQKLVYNQIVKRDNIMTHENYFKKLEEIGELA